MKRCSRCPAERDRPGQRLCSRCHAANMRAWRAMQAETEKWIGGIAFALQALNDVKAKRKSRNVSRGTIVRAVNKALKV